MVVDIADVVTYTNFGDHRLRGFWVAGGQISPLSSPIDFHRRPYNTLTLLCERVIGVMYADFIHDRTTPCARDGPTEQLAKERRKYVDALFW